MFFFTNFVVCYVEREQEFRKNSNNMLFLKKFSNKKIIFNSR